MPPPRSAQGPPLRRQTDPPPSCRSACRPACRCGSRAPPAAPSAPGWPAPGAVDCGLEEATANRSRQSPNVLANDTVSPGYPAGISAVVPVFNSAGLIAELEGELEEVLRGIGRPFEVILVNDGSSDESWQVIRRLADRHPWVRGVDLMRNYGPAQRAAVRHPRRIDGRRLERSA